MKRSMLVCLSLVFLMINGSVIYPQNTLFEKGVVYLLLEDYQQSGLFFNEYFSKNPNPIVHRGFMLLTRKDIKNAKEEFKNYLNMNFRSLHAIVGISLALTDLRESTSKENLQKAIRLNSGFSSAYACLGMEYLKENNFPMAEKYLSTAARLKNLMEYRILLGELYLAEGKPGKTLTLIENDVQSNPDNFYLNYLMARTFYDLGHISSMGRYIQISRDLAPSDREVQILYTNYLLLKGEPKAAREILRDIRYNEFNAGYIKTSAGVLLALGDRKAKDYLYQYYNFDNWDPDINRLMAKYYLKNRTDRSNIQNWIYRAILSGNDPLSLKNEFGTEFLFPSPASIGFFDIKKVFWIDSKKLFVVGVLSSGGIEKLYLIDFEKKKLISAYEYDGILNGLYFSGSRDRLVFETENQSSKRTRLYSIQKNPSGSYTFRSIYSAKEDTPRFDVVFSPSGSIAYFIDSSIEDISFESPFSKVNRFGEKRPVYTGLSNFVIYKYSFMNNRFSYVDDAEEINSIHSDSIKKYMTVYTAASVTKEVANLIKRGEGLDSFSAEVVKIRFSRDLGSFLIYLADLKNSFQAIVFDNETGKITKVNSEMFLEDGRFAELEIVDFNSDKNRLIFITKDNKRDLISFNYRSRLYRKLVENYYSGCFSSTRDRFFILTERNRKHFLIETLFKTINLDPFWIEEKPERRDLKNIIACEDTLLRVTTNGGEILEMGYDGELVYISPSYEGSIHSFDPEFRNAAVFINKRLYLIDNTTEWAKEAGLKK